ncbi:hypothetical protein GE09DRAFT_1054044 [Coniochaeta sp. 2T2.1]|nr:hypothetical protein GE09DRAFT_1054044 [Coniochaeta sp. 2T2.1]
MPANKFSRKSSAKRSDTPPRQDDSSDSENDYDVESEEPQLPVVIKNGWTLRGTFLTFKGHPRMSVARLRLVLGARGRTTPKSAEEMEAKAYIEGTNLQQFLHSQMAHYNLFPVYGMDINGSYISKSMESKLLRAVSNGMCDNVPQSVLKITRKLGRKNRSAMEAYHEELAQWNARRNRKQTVSEARIAEETEEQESEADQEWRRLERNPGERANIDLDRFFDEYFQTEGTTDHSKTTRAISLEGLNDRAEMILRVKTIPGLFFLVASKAAGSAVILGFDLEKVKTLLKKVEAEAVKTFEDQWWSNYTTHTALLRRHRAGAGRKILGLADCAGTYYAQWTGPENNNSRLLTYDVTLHVSPTLVANDRALIAAFDFGVCAGTMHLSEHAEALDDLADGQYDADVDPDDAAPTTPRGKRKMPPTKYRSPRVSKRRSLPLTPPQADAMGLPARLELSVSFRGRKTLDGDNRIFHAPRSGKFEFWDASYCRISGEVDLPGHGTVKVEAWQISDTVTADEEPSPWDEFSEIAFRRERIQARKEQEDQLEGEMVARQPVKKKKAKNEKRGGQKRLPSGSSSR